MNDNQGLTEIIWYARIVLIIKVIKTTDNLFFNIKVLVVLVLDKAVVIMVTENGKTNLFEGTQQCHCPRIGPTDYTLAVLKTYLSNAWMDVTAK